MRVYITDLQPFLTFLENEKLDVRELDRRRLRHYLAWLSTSARGKDGGYARVSVARKLIALRSFYRFLAQEKFVAANPIPKGRSFNIKVQKRLPTFLGREEVERLVNAPSESGASERSDKYPGRSDRVMRDEAILELLYSSGVRLSELHGIDVGDVDLAAREVRGAWQRLQGARRPAGESRRGVPRPLYTLG